MRFFPHDADRTWLDTEDFRVTFQYWRNELSKRRDVFLGYSGSSKGTAQNLKRFLEKDLDITVLECIPIVRAEASIANLLSSAIG